MIVNAGMQPPATPIGLGIAGQPAPMPPAVGVPTPDGGMEFPDPEPDDPLDLRKLEHDANLAEVMDDAELARIGYKLREGIDADLESNQPMFEMFEAGMKLIVYKPGTRMDKPFAGATATIHPILLEACIRGASEDRGEMLPASGPVRCQIIGDQTPELEALAERKAAWLNYYLTEEDEEYYPDFDQMLLLRRIYGSMFRKVYRDPLRNGKPVSRALTPHDLIVNANARSLTGPWRVTQIEQTPQSDMRRLQLQGWYRDIELAKPYGGDETPAQVARSAVESIIPSDYDDDEEYTIYHCHCLLDLPGLEHGDDDPTGLPLPYIVSLEKDTAKILRIARNWDKKDPDFRPREYFVHYILWPGTGFYGWGMIHLLGSTAETLTMMTRQGINTNTLNTFPGGFRAKGMRPESSDMPIGPCEFRELDTGGLPIQQAVMTLPYPPLPPSFIPFFQQVLGDGQRLASLGDMAVGDGREDALPGTVIALIEKATKLETTITKRGHVAQRQEYRLLADLFGADPDEKYPYVMNGKSGTAVAADFQDNSDVVPVSDPNIPTQTQRMAAAQAKWQLAQQSGGLISAKEALTDFLRTMGSTEADIARLMPDPAQAQPSDPVTEFAALMKGAPLAAGPLQNHQAHIAAHMAQIAVPGLDKMPQHAALLAHIGDHLAMFYAAEASRLTGHQITPGQVPPQMQDQVALAVAQQTAQLRAALLQVMPNQPGADPSAALDAQVKMADLQFKERDAQRKAVQAAQQNADQERRNTQDMANDAAERQTRLAEAHIALKQEELRTHATMVDAQKDQATALIEAQADRNRAMLETHQAAIEAHSNVAASAHKTKQSELAVDAAHAKTDAVKAAAAKKPAQ